MCRGPACRMQTIVRCRLGICARAQDDNRPRRRWIPHRRTNCGTSRRAYPGCTARNRCHERTPTAEMGPCRAAYRCGYATARPARRWSARGHRRFRPGTPSRRCAPRTARAPHRQAAYASRARRCPCPAGPGSGDRRASLSYRGRDYCAAFAIGAARAGRKRSSTWPGPLPSRV